MGPLLVTSWNSTCLFNGSTLPLAETVGDVTFFNVAVTVTPSPGPRLPKHRDRMAEAVTVPVHWNTAAGFVPTAV